MNEELVKYIAKLLLQLQAGYKNTPIENSSVRNLLMGKIEAYKDILNRL